MALRVLGRSVVFPGARRPYFTTGRLACKAEKAAAEGEKTPHLREPPVHSSPFGHEVSEWDKKLLLWSGRYKRKEDIPPQISAKVMSGARSTLRVRVAYVAMAILLAGFVSAVVIGKQDVQKYRSLRYMHIEEIEKEAESTSPKP